MNIVKRITAANAGREPERLAMKYAAMRSGPFVFLRGTCRLFYDHLPQTGIFRSAPPVWSCGDLHLENFGSYKADNRLAYFDINDFDEAALAPATWDLARMLTSIRVGSRAYGVSQAHGGALVRHFLEAYSAALSTGKARWIERETASGLVRTLLDQLRLRNRRDFLDGRTRKKNGCRAFLIDGKRTLAASATQREEVGQCLRRFAASQPDPAFYEVLDVARRIAGTGSLGVDRYVVLVTGKGSPDRNYILDLKQALPSSIGARLPARQPAWTSEAERIVAVQRRMQAVSAALLHSVMHNGQAYVLREQQPSEDRVPLASRPASIDELAGLMQTMGECLAWAQLRSTGRDGSASADELIAFGNASKWRQKLETAAADFEAQVQSDWEAYARAYDLGVFSVPGAGPG